MQRRKKGREGEVDLNPTVSQKDFLRSNLPSCITPMRTNFKDGIRFVGAGGMDGNKKGKVNSGRKETFRREAPSFFETILIEFNCGAVEGDVKRISK